MIETCLCIPLSYLMDTSLSRGGDKGFLFADHLTRGASVNQSPSKFENCFPKLTAVLLGQFIRSWGGSIYLSAIAAVCNRQARRHNRAESKVHRPFPSMPAISVRV